MIARSGAACGDPLGFQALDALLGSLDTKGAASEQLAGARRRGSHQRVSPAHART
jgi:hypothetical protein